MAVIDFDVLLADVSPEEPSGPDLEYDPLFGEMERAAEGRPEQQFGDTVVSAEDADWKELRKAALSVLAQSKDMRAAAYLVQSLTHTDGLIGLGSGLALLRGLVEKFWDSIHPQLDPEDDLDPTIRVNILTSLCDQESMLHYVRLAPLVSSKMLGRFSLRDIAIAAGDLPAPDPDTPPPDITAIDAAFMDCELEDLQATSQAVAEGMGDVQALEAFVTDKVGASQAASLGDLVQALKEAQHVLAEQLVRRGVSVEQEGAEAGNGAADSGPGGGPALAGEVRSRDDVIRALDKIIDYYQRYEPSSPVPLLVQRAKRLVAKDFMEILQDIVPESITQAQNITGAKTE